MSFYAVSYETHFEDTMAYGSHHFLTNFKFQCAGREHLLFSDGFYGDPAFREAFANVVLLTHEAMSKNLAPARLGDRLVVLVSVEARTPVGIRFCFRTLHADGTPVAAGFQTVLCANHAGGVVPFPAAFERCIDAAADLFEPAAKDSFRDRVIAGGRGLREIFSDEVRALARRLLAGAGRFVPSVVSLEQTPRYSDGEAWLFGGQGGFDVAHLARLIRVQPDARLDLDEVVHAITGRGAGVAELLSGDASRAAAAIARDPELDQLGILFAGLLGYRAARGLGRRPDVLVGHSFGEITALAAAGALSWVDAARVVEARSVALRGAPRGGLAACSGGRAVVEPLLAGTGVVVAGENHDAQLVVAGDPDALDALAGRLAATGVMLTRVPSRVAFHHPDLAAASALFLEGMREVRFQEAHTAVWSPIGGGLMDQRGLAEALASHLVRPFQFGAATRALRERGVTRWVDLATGGRLGRLVSRALGEAQVVDLLGELSDPGAPVEPVVARDPAAARRAPIAIVGMGCVLPGGADSPASFERQLVEGWEGIVDDALDPEAAQDFGGPKGTRDRSYSLLAGKVRDGDIRCPSGVSAGLFAGWTRAQRLLAVALAQVAPTIRPNERVACLLGCTADGCADYDAALAAQALGGGDPAVRGAVAGALGLSPAHAALASEGRASALAPFPTLQSVVAAVLGEGVSLTLLDAACASSLYTTALGVELLRRGEVDRVIAGGVFSPGPGNNCLFAQFGGLSARGSRPFDATADGVVFGEGAAVLAMTRVGEGGEPLAILRGVGLSSDGRSSSANVPRSEGQVLAMERCYASMGLKVEDVGVIEAHGTATPTGDATELRSLTAVFGGVTGEPVLLGSLKALIGHTGWLAGTASLIKLTLALRSGSVPPQHRFEQPSAALTAAGPRFAVPRAVTPWPAGRRLGATNGFGFGGTNAHAVVESYDPVRHRAVSPCAVDEGLVLVGHAAVDPSDGVALPAGVRLLPDLAEDVDPTQLVATRLAAAVLGPVFSCEPALKERTAVVLGMQGKTARGVEATARVLAGRAARRLRGAVADSVRAAGERLRPSGAYTLQGMMPNVTPGRVANLLDLKGPNFVIDAGPSTEAEVARAARLLLSAGMELVVTGRMGSAFGGGASVLRGELSVVTTEALAARLGLTVLARLDTTAVPASTSGLTGALEPHDPRDRRPAAAAPSVPSAGLDDGQQVEIAAANANASVADAATGLRSGSPSVEAPGRESTENQVKWASAAMAARRMGPLASHGSEAASTRSPSIGWGAEGAAVEPQPASREPLTPPASGAEADRRPTAGFAAPAPSRGGFDVEAPIRDLEPVLVERSLTADPTPWRGERVLLVVEDAGAADALRLAGAEVRVATRDGDALGFDPSWPSVVLTVARPSPEPLDGVRSARPALDAHFLAAKAVYERLGRADVDLCAVVVGGVTAGLLHPATGLFGGFSRSVSREVPADHVFALAVGGEDDVLAALAAERGARAGAVESVWEGGVRSVLALREVDAPAAGAPLLERGAVVIATGGARGVTALLVAALLERFEATVHVLGRSDPATLPAWLRGAEPSELDELERRFYQDERAKDPTQRIGDLRRRFDGLRAAHEVHHTLERLSALPGRVVYHPVDVTREADVDAVLDHVASVHGRLDLVVHGAGTQTSKRLDRRGFGEWRRNLDTKLEGARLLAAGAAARFTTPPRFHVLSSAFSTYGNDGQADYGAANLCLDRLCAAYSALRGAGAWTSVGWLAWDRIGMTASSEYSTLGGARGLRGVGAAEGAAIFMALVAQTPRTAVHVQVTDAEQRWYGLEVLGPDAWLEIDARTVPVLRAHVVDGVPTLPGAYALDQLVAAAVPVTSGAVQLTDVRFERFVRVPEGRTRALRVRRDGARRLRLVADLVHPSGRVLRRDLAFDEATWSAAEVEHPKLQPMAERGVAAQDPYCASGPIRLGGEFDCLRDIRIGATGRTARFAPPDGAWAGARIPALMLDAAMRLSAMHAAGVSDTLYAPVGIGRVWCAAQAPAAAPMTLRATAPVLDGDEVRSARVEAVDAQGRLALVVEAGVARRIGHMHASS